MAKGFHQAPRFEFDDTLSANINPTIFILVYVDDITFSLKQLGHLDYFLGIEIKQLPNESLLMTQSEYIHDLLHKTNLVEAHFFFSYGFFQKII